MLGSVVEGQHGGECVGQVEEHPDNTLLCSSELL